MPSKGHSLTRVPFDPSDEAALRERRVSMWQQSAEVKDVRKLTSCRPFPCHPILRSAQFNQSHRTPIRILSSHRIVSYPIPPNPTQPISDAIGRIPSLLHDAACCPARVLRR